MWCRSSDLQSIWDVYCNSNGAESGAESGVGGVRVPDLFEAFA